ncbi:MAG TPA: diguanylate cyclase [Tepidisphaeraceae bacterium]|nr:diguanylate cyclase [Tepidisphaeraceae bacterium]
MSASMMDPANSILCSAASASAIGNRPIRLLIVEDDADQRELMIHTLEAHFGEGTVVSVGGRREALDQPLDAFDLILADYNLPDSEGLALLDEIRRRCATPVILVTGENVGQIAADAIRRGATDYVVKLGDYLFAIPLVVEKNLTTAAVMRENDSLREELQRALREVRDKNIALEQSLKKLEEVAATDPLTGLYNRRHFGRVLEQLFSEAQRYDTDLTCIMIDLDEYKRLNDTYGHQIGDQLLVVAAKAISSNLRTMDIAARYGGDEFICLLPHAGAAEAQGVAERIREQFGSASANLLKWERRVTMSIGIGSLSEHRPDGFEQLVALADAALYRAKGAGKDSIIAAGQR